MNVTQGARDSHTSLSLAFSQALGFMQVFTFVRVDLMVTGLFD